MDSLGAEMATMATTDTATWTAKVPPKALAELVAANTTPRVTAIPTGPSFKVALQESVVAVAVATTEEAQVVAGLLAMTRGQHLVVAEAVG